MSDAIEHCAVRESSMSLAADSSPSCSEVSGSSRCSRSALWAMDSDDAVESERAEVSERLAIIDGAANSNCLEYSGGADDKCGALSRSGSAPAVSCGADDKCGAVSGGDSTPAVNGLRMRIKRTRDDSDNRHEIIQRSEDVTSNHPTRVRRPPVFFSVQHPKPKRIRISKTIKQLVAASTTPVDQPRLPAVQSNCVSSVRSRGTQVSAAELGPSEPGASILLQGYVWHETSNGLLVVSVTWRGRSYSGTLLDSTQHQWASSRPVAQPAMEEQEASVRGFPVGLRRITRGRVRRRGRGRPRGACRTTSRSNLLGLDSITYTQKSTARFTSLMPEPISNSDTEGSVGIISPLNYNPLCQSTSVLRSNVSSPSVNELIDCPCNGCHKQFANPDALCSHILHCHPVTSTAKNSRVYATNSSEENGLERCSSTSKVDIMRDVEFRDVRSPMMPCPPQSNSSTKVSISCDSYRPQSLKTDAELFQTLHRGDKEARGVRKLSSESHHSADEGGLQIDWECLQTCDDPVDVNIESCGSSSSRTPGVSKDQLNEIRGRTLKVLVTDIALQSDFRKSEEANITQDFSCIARDHEQLNERSSEVVNEPAAIDRIQHADPGKTRTEQRKHSKSGGNMSLPRLLPASKTQVHDNQQNSIMVNPVTTGSSPSGSAVSENNFTLISSLSSPVTEAVIPTTTTAHSLVNAHHQSKDDDACSFSLLPGYQYPPGFPIPLVLNTVFPGQTIALLEKNKRHPFRFPTGLPSLPPKSVGILSQSGPGSNHETKKDAGSASTERESSSVIPSAGSVSLPVRPPKGGSLPILPTGKRRSSLIRPTARGGSSLIRPTARSGSSLIRPTARSGSSLVFPTARSRSSSALSTAVQVSPSVLSTAGRGSSSVLSTAGRGSSSVLSTAGRGSSSVLSTAIQVSPSVLSTAIQGSPSVLSTAERGSPSVLSTARGGSSSVHRSTGSVCLVGGSVPVGVHVSCIGGVGSVPRSRIVSTQSRVSDGYLVSGVTRNERYIRPLPSEPQRPHHRRSPPPLFPLRMVAPRSVPVGYPDCTAAPGAVPCVQTVCTSLIEVCPDGQPSDIWAQTLIPAVQTSSFMSLFPATMCIPVYLRPAGDHQHVVSGGGEQRQLQRSADGSCLGIGDDNRPSDDTQQNPASLDQVLAAPGGLQPYPELFRAGIPNQQSFQ